MDKFAIVAKNILDRLLNWISTFRVPAVDLHTGSTDTLAHYRIHQTRYNWCPQYIDSATCTLTNGPLLSTLVAHLWRSHTINRTSCHSYKITTWFHSYRHQFHLSSKRRHYKTGLLGSGQGQFSASTSLRKWTCAAVRSHVKWEKQLSIQVEWLAMKGAVGGVMKPRDAIYWVKVNTSYMLAIYIQIPYILFDWLVSSINM